MTTDAILILTICFSAFVQGISGFGFALVAMPVLAGLTSIYIAAPLVALTTLTNNTFMCLYYRRSFSRAIVVKMLCGSIVGIPLGLLALQYLPVSFMLMALGLTIVSYAVYTLLTPVTPVLKSQKWLYSSGFLSGILIGSFNMPGPPAILYGNNQRWPQEKFKSNLTGFFWINGLLVTFGHGVQQRLTPEVLHQYLITIPGLVIGLITGIALSNALNPLTFRRIILGVLMVIGARLLVMGAQS